MIHSHPIIEQVLESNKVALSKDFDRYRNHVYRVFNLCLLIDSDIKNIDKYAIAAVFHDIGIWTDQTFDYLKPSIKRMVTFLNDHQLNELEKEISLMINFHHKINPYNGDLKKTVETFRQADWIVVSKSLIKFSLSKNEIEEINETFPALGFHRFLFDQTVKRFSKHPFNPIPMFKF